jgi:glycosyltransferase involved in cell wall biosynthesis
MLPVFSIVLCTYNALPYLEECIQSLLQQTYADFELIIVDDGSTDGTIAYLNALTDQRLRIIPLDTNRGLIFARNKGFEAAKGRYIAIMDADDIAHPARLEEQRKILDSGDVDVCGSFHISLDSKSGKRRSRRSATSDSDIRALLSIYCPLCNPSTSARADVLRRHRYNPAYPHAEDYGLWCDIATHGGRFHNIAQPLLTYRLHPSQVSVVKKETANSSFEAIQTSYVQTLTGQGIVPHSMPATTRLRQATAFMRTINNRIPGISYRANYELYAEFQYRKNGWLTIPTRLERALVALWATTLGRRAEAHMPKQPNNPTD